MSDLDMDFIPILMNTLKLEGNYTEDSGGKTNFGVTQNTFDAYTKENNIPSKDVKDLNFGDVRNFYQKEFYEKPKIFDIPYKKIKSMVFDFGVNAGTPTAIKTLQKIVGTKADGIKGNKTNNAISKYVEKYGEDDLYDALVQARIEHYQNLVKSNPDKYGQYLNGWLNRLTKLAEMNSK
jgi:lysozyme family protein